MISRNLRRKIGATVKLSMSRGPNRVSDNTPFYGRRWNARQRGHTIGSCCNTSHCNFVGFISYYTLPASQIPSNVDDPDLTTSPERMDGESDERHFNLDQSAGSG